VESKPPDINQGLLQRTQRIAAHAIVLAMNDEQALVADFQAHHHVRLFQVDAGGAALLAQLAADNAIDVHRGETVLAGAFGANRKDLSRQQRAKMLFALGHNVVHVAQRILVHLQEVRDARRATQALGHLPQDFGVHELGLHLKVVPHAIDHQLGVQIAEHHADVLGELTDEPLAHRRALDGDFWKDFYDKFHENSARNASRKRGARIIAEIAQGLTSYRTNGFYAPIWTHKEKHRTKTDHP